MYIVLGRPIGIPAEAQSYVFESFRQVNGSPTREYSGTGLGPSIVKQLTALMGEEIILKSQVRVGTTFAVQFPLTAVQEVRQ